MMDKIMEWSEFTDYVDITSDFNWAFNFNHELTQIVYLYICIPYSKNPMADLMQGACRIIISDKVYADIPLSAFDFNFRDVIGMEGIKRISVKGNKMMHYEFKFGVPVTIGRDQESRFEFRFRKKIPEFQFIVRGWKRRVR